MTSARKILVVDDEAQIRRLLKITLAREGHVVVEAGTARAALSAVDIDRPDVILLDLGLPDRDGLELLPLLKARTSAPVIVVSARADTAQKVAALDLGADDFVTKPFDTDELLARVRAAVRHGFDAEGVAPVVRSGAIEIDLAGRRVLRDGAAVELSARELAVLAELARHPGRIVTHAQLLAAGWGPAQDDRIQYLRLIVRDLRRKLEADPSAPTLIVNDHGIGYRLGSA